MPVFRGIVGWRRNAFTESELPQDHRELGNDVAVKLATVSSKQDSVYTTSCQHRERRVQFTLLLCCCCVPRSTTSPADESFLKATCTASPTAFPDLPPISAAAAAACIPHVVCCLHGASKGVSGEARRTQPLVLKRFVYTLRTQSSIFPASIASSLALQRSLLNHSNGCRT